MDEVLQTEPSFIETSLDKPAIFVEVGEKRTPPVKGSKLVTGKSRKSWGDVIYPVFRKPAAIPLIVTTITSRND